MLKRVVLLFSVSALLVSCLAKRQVLEENLFQSSIPSLMIKVDHQIPYLGKTESSKFNYSESSSRSVGVPERHDSFYFAKVGRNNKIDRFFMIVISNLEDSNWYYIDDFNDWWDDPLHLGTVEFANRTYNAAYAILSLKGGDIAKYFNSKSFFLADCYALKVLHRLPNSDTKVLIWYGEACEKFSRQYDLNSIAEDQKQKSIRQGLDKNFVQAIVPQE